MAEKIIDIPGTVERLYASQDCEFLTQKRFAVKEVEGLTSFDMIEQVLVRDDFHPDGLGVKDWLHRLTDSVDVVFDSHDLETVALDLEWRIVIQDTVRGLNG